MNPCLRQNVGQKELLDLILPCIRACSDKIVKARGLKTEVLAIPGQYAQRSETRDHLAEAVSMGYNVYEEKDNEAFALYLFKTQGSEPWSSSKAGWKK